MIFYVLTGAHKQDTVFPAHSITLRLYNSVDMNACDVMLILSLQY